MNATSSSSLLSAIVVNRCAVADNKGQILFRDEFDTAHLYILTSSHERVHGERAALVSLFGREFWQVVACE